MALIDHLIRHHDDQRTDPAYPSVEVWTFRGLNPYPLPLRRYLWRVLGAGLLILLLAGATVAAIVGAVLVILRADSVLQALNVIPLVIGAILGPFAAQSLLYHTRMHLELMEMEHRQGYRQIVGRPF